MKRDAIQHRLERFLNSNPHNVLERLAEYFRHGLIVGIRHVEMALARWSGSDLVHVEVTLQDPLLEVIWLPRSFGHLLDRLLGSCDAGGLLMAHGTCRRYGRLASD